MMTLSHNQIKELIPAYVLEAVSPEEMDEIRVHILSCQECMTEADALGEARTVMDLSVEPMPLPAGFADRVMDVVSESAPQRRQAPSRTPGRMFLLPAIASFAAALAVIAALAFFYVDARSNLQRQRDVLAAVLSSDQGMDLRGEMNAVAKVVSAGDGSLFVATGLQQAPEGRVYQLWLMRGRCGNKNVGTPACEKFGVATFEAEGDVTVVRLDASVGRFDRAAVTLEPEGGSQQPTGPPIIIS